MGDARWVIGWAMVGRAEFAYFIAIYAKSLKMMDEELFAILVWALLYATVFAPLVFRKVLARYMRKKGARESVIEAIMSAPTDVVDVHFPDLIAEAEHQEKIDNKKTMQKNAEMIRQFSSEASAHEVEINDRQNIIEQKDREIQELKAALKQFEADSGTKPFAPVLPTKSSEDFRMTVSSI